MAGLSLWVLFVVIIQIGRERILGYDTCFLDYFLNGEYMIIGGSNKQVINI